MGVRELHHPLAEVGLDDLDAEPFEVGVELDLFAGHRLDLGHDHASPRRQPAARVPAQLSDDVAGFGRIFGQVDDAADSGEALRELLEQLGQAVEVRQPSGLELGASLGEVEIFEGRVTPGAQAGHGLDQRFLEVRVVQRAVDAAGEVTTTLRHSSSRLL